MRCEIDYYRTRQGDCPVEEFISSLPVKLRAKNMRAIGLLEEMGRMLPEPHAVNVTGKRYAGLWELRVKLGSDITRIFYFFFPTGDRALLLHGFVKKSNPTPPSELERARSYMKDAMERKL